MATDIVDIYKKGELDNENNWSSPSKGTLFKSGHPGSGVDKVVDADWVRGSFNSAFTNIRTNKFIKTYTYNIWLHKSNNSKS